MAGKPIIVAQNIVKAMNSSFGTHVVINMTQFYDGDNKLAKVYHVKDIYRMNGTMDFVDHELFRSSSGVYICLFVRDLLYALQGKEIPHEENEGYNNVCVKRDANSGIKYMLDMYRREDS